IGEFMPLDPFPEDLSWARNIALVFMVVSVIYLGYDNLVVQRKEPIFGMLDLLIAIGVMVGFVVVVVNL
ncbi:MAG TPA: hypothetical protein VJ327_01655, partial [Patescibacteria group bacterium]|nr:hypothetical protein [Patescibacteria group bacterium]